MFSKETYISRREKLKKQFQSGILLFLGNDECGSITKTIPIFIVKTAVFIILD